MDYSSCSNEYLKTQWEFFKTEIETDNPISQEEIDFLVTHKKAIELELGNRPSLIGIKITVKLEQQKPIETYLVNATLNEYRKYYYSDGYNIKRDKHSFQASKQSDSKTRKIVQVEKMSLLDYEVRKSHEN